MTKVKKKNHRSNAASKKAPLNILAESLYDLNHIDTELKRLQSVKAYKTLNEDDKRKMRRELRKSLESSTVKLRSQLLANQDTALPQHLSNLNFLPGNTAARHAEEVLGMLDVVVAHYQEDYPTLDVAKAFLALNRCTTACGANHICFHHSLPTAAAIWILDRLLELGQIERAKEVLPEEMLLGLAPNRAKSLALPFSYFTDSIHPQSLIEAMQYVIEKKDGAEPTEYNLTLMENETVATNHPGDENNFRRTEEFYESVLDRCDAGEDVSCRDRLDAILSLIPFEYIAVTIKGFRNCFWSTLDECMLNLEAMQDAILEGYKQLRPAIVDYKNAKERERTFDQINTVPTLNDTAEIQILTDIAIKRVTKMLLLLGKEQDMYEDYCSFFRSFYSRERIDTDETIQSAKYMDDIFGGRFLDPYAGAFAAVYMADQGYTETWISPIFSTTLLMLTSQLPWASGQVNSFGDDDEEELALEDEALLSSLRKIGPKEIEMHYYEEMKKRDAFLNTRVVINKPQRGKRLASDGYFFTPAQFIFNRTRTIPPRTLRAPADQPFTIQALFAIDGKTATKNTTRYGFSTTESSMLYREMCIAARMGYLANLGPHAGQDSRLGAAVTRYVKAVLVDEVFEGTKAEKAETVIEEKESEGANDKLSAALAENKRLREKLKLTKSNLDATRSELKTKSIALQQSNEERTALQSENEDLRKLVFKDDVPEEDTPKWSQRIEFPFHTTLRMYVIGGHDSWLKAMKPMVPDVKFVGDSKSCDLGFIKAADIIWIQTNAISHTLCYRVIGAAKNHHIPIRYFPKDGARNCALMIAKAETEATSALSMADSPTQYNKRIIIESSASCRCDEKFVAPNESE